jgi:ligand-binding sensor domain-containing protein
MDSIEENNLKRKFHKLSWNGKILWILIFCVLLIIISSFTYLISIRIIQHNSLTYTPNTFPITKITFDPQGRAWMRTWRGPLVVFDGKEWIIFEKADYISTEDKLLSNIAFDLDGMAWIGTWGNGYITIDAERWEKSFSAGEMITEIAVDPKGRVWVGNLRSVIRVFNGDREITFDQDNSPLRGSLNEITFDINGNVWIGTSDGLFVYNGDSWKIYSESNSGLVNNQVQVIGFDSHNQAWI